MEYTITEHKHRYAAWAASRAASTSTACRFSVQQGKEIIEVIGLHKITHPDQLPSQHEIDEKHTNWRCEAIAAAQNKGIKNFTHGVAAKLINIYLKSIFVCGGYDQHEKVINLHPPIDRLLLNELQKNNTCDLKKTWAEYKHIGWSKFDSNTYQSVIEKIRAAMGEDPLWKIESFWRGYQ